MIAGVVTLKCGDLAMPIEVHIETEDAYEGYNLANPNGAYRSYAKHLYEVVSDERLGQETKR